MTKRLVITTITLFTLFTAHAQQTGIQFVSNLNWFQVLKKAKEEHKYIFVDCYATWCGPCKFMDANIYPKKEVGDAYNNYISVRMQIDQTPKDNDSIKAWHAIPAKLEKDYNVNAYPTFLFFDENGKPVHKATGSMSEEHFIRLAKDAQNPKKQYYAILNNFKPGTLDTAEEKGLAFSFINTDKELATKLALDYFSRIPKKSMTSPNNINLLQGLQAKAEIAQLPENYLKRLKSAGWKKKANLIFAENFNRDILVRKLAKAYVKSLSDEQLLNKQMISFMEVFTDSTAYKKGFNFFYNYPQKIDAVTGKDEAEKEVQKLIRNAEYTPALNKAKLTGIAPNFDSIKTAITQKYNAEYADRVIIASKPGWYFYLVNEKKQDQYWPVYVAAWITEVNRFRIDTARGAEGFINDSSWRIFVNDTVKSQLITVAGWMKGNAERNPIDMNTWDTYACLLYKIGQNDEAIKAEERALSNATKNKNKDDIAYCNKTIEKMKAGEAIWLEKEYQQ